MAEFRPLNPRLYFRLVKLFGRVKVTWPGERFRYKPASSLQGRPRLVILHSGEYYHVNCPFCGDTRKRLDINHRYGTKDDFGRNMTFLAVCHNETACMARPENQQELWEAVSGQDPAWLERAPIRPGLDTDDESREFPLPGPCVPLHELEGGHEARAYVELRGFDPDVLGRVYGVSYCLHSHYFHASRRLIFPVYDGGKLRGWQARYIGELDWKDKTKHNPPKYYTCPGMRKSTLLYNLDRAKRYETGVIVEGPTDACRFGAMAVCTFGDTMGDVQKRKFLAVFRRRTGVLLYDPAEMHEPSVVRLRESLATKMSGRFAAVCLPSGTDPGSLTRKFLRDYVREHAAACGVEVRWRKVCADE